MKKLILLYFLLALPCLAQQQNFGGGGGGLTQVAALPGTCTPSTTAPVQLTVAPFGIYNCTTTNAWTQAGGAFSSYVDPVAQFGIIQDGKWVTDATFNTAQTTCGAGSGLPAGTCVTITASDPPFTCPSGAFPCTSGGDNGKQEFGTYGCAGANPGACFKAVPKGTIVEVWDATHAQVSVAAVHNSSGTMNNFAWGSSGNGAKLQNMANYLANNPGTAAAFACSGQSVNAPTTGGAGAIWIDSNNSAPMLIPAHANPIGIKGCAGGIGTLFISCPDPGPTALLQNGSSYTVGNSPYPGTFGSYDQFSDLIFWGLGNDTGTNEGHALITIQGPALLNNVWTFGYAYNVVNTYVINGIFCNGCTMINSGSYVGGNFPCQLTGSSNNFFQTKMIGGICGGTNNAGITLNGGVSTDGGGMISIDTSYLYGSAGIYGVVNSSTVPVTITGSYLGGLSQTGTGTLNLFGNNIDRFTSLAPFAINNVGGTINALGNVINGQGNAFLSQSSGTFRDLGGNSISNLVTPTITGGLYTGSASPNNTLVTAAKLVLSAGWGSTAANTALSGGNAPIQFTITNSGVGQAANPTITYTFPNQYQVAPFSCSATQTGGTNASLAPYTSSGLSATGVTFTATGTPTAGNTEIMQVTCVTP